MLIIWDRIFGTFTPESEKVIYGLVHPLNSWNPLWAQFHHIYYIISNTGLKKGFLNKLYFLLKGPGWSPGKPRLGSIEDIPQVCTLKLCGFGPSKDIMLYRWVFGLFVCLCFQGQPHNYMNDSVI